VTSFIKVTTFHRYWLYTVKDSLFAKKSKRYLIESSIRMLLKLIISIYIINMLDLSMF